MRLSWSVLSLEDREGIFDHIARDDPRAAVALDGRIAARAAGLIRFPESGRPGRVEGTRELVVGRTPYVVVYRAGADGVQVLRVLHGTRRWPEEPLP